MNNTDKEKLNIQEVLKAIDNSELNYYTELDDELKKQFQPYTVLRWFSALDDSVQFSVPAKNIENVVGKWSGDGKKTLSMLQEEFNSSSTEGVWINTSKYEHAKYDWRIKFSTENIQTAMSVIEQLGITHYDINGSIDKITAEYHLKTLNDLVNVNFWDLSKKPEMVYELMCCISFFIGTGEKEHSWIPFCKNKKSFNKEIMYILKGTVSELSSNQFSIDEYKILLSCIDEREFSVMLSELGKSDSDTKKLIKTYNEEREKYGFKKAKTNI